MKYILPLLLSLILLIPGNAPVWAGKKHKKVSKRAALRAMKKARKAVRKAKRAIRKRDRKTYAKKRRYKRKKRRYKRKKWQSRKVAWQKAKEEVLALFKKHDLAYEPKQRRLTQAHFGLPKKLGAFPITVELAPRIRFWAKIFGAYRSNEIVLYNPKRHIFITHFAVKGGELSPDDPYKVRRKKSRKRVKHAAKNMRKLRTALRTLARLEKKAERQERAHWWKLRRSLCRTPKSWRARRLCRKALTFSSARINAARWNNYFKGLDAYTRSIFKRINEEPHMNGPDGHKLFRLLASQRISWQSSYRGFYKKGMRFEQRYHKHIARILKASKLPPQLAALPFVESMYNPSVRSYAGAVGLWQLMPDTGKENSMYIVHRRKNRSIFPFDERLDPLMATKGATRFLHLCRHYFPKNWPLAITSYNQGPGRMLKESKKYGRNLDKIIKRSRTRSFGFDGRNFYAKFVASAYIIQKQKTFFKELPTRGTLHYTTISFPRPVWFRDLTRITGMSAASIKMYNPSLFSLKWNRKFPIPAHYPLRIAPSKYKKYKRSIKQFQQYGRSLRLVKAIKGDNLYRIARRHNVSWRVLERVNRPYAHLARLRKKPKRRRSLCAKHTVKQHKALAWKKKKKRCAPLSPKKRIVRGSLIRIPAVKWASPAEKTFTYRVRGTEPLAFIACKHCTTVWHLRKLNPKLTVRRLRPGTKVIVPTCSRYRRKSMYRYCGVYHFGGRRRYFRKRRKRRRRRRRRARRRKRRSKKYVKRKRRKRRSKKYVKRSRRKRKYRRRVSRR